MILYNESVFFLSHVLEQKPVLSITLKFNSAYPLQKHDSSFDNGVVTIEVYSMGVESSELMTHLHWHYHAIPPHMRV